MVTGSSAGGIEALSHVLAALPAGFAAPIVIAQHLDPRVRSSLPAILAKRTALRIVAVEERATLEPGTVYVVAADRHVEISDHEVFVHADGQHGRPKPSIDLLFATAAGVYGSRLIAVVLSGLGSDGSVGARAVKLHGGTVIIEDPLTATFPAMPSALEPAVVDIVAPVGAIGAALIRLLAEPDDLPDESPELAELLNRVREKSGIDFAHYKMPTIKRRLWRQITTANRAGLTDYLAYLEEDPDEFSRLINAFLIKVTEFFRDRELFDALRVDVIPSLIAQARKRGSREVRLWSAGCASGEEAYSLAIVVAEALRDERELFNVRIFATDIDEAALSFARRGVYPVDALADLDPALVARYFTSVEDGWEVGKSIRNMTVFGQHDLGQRAPFPRIDLAVCRNVLIYFSKELQQRTLHVFAFSLRNGGYLALGKAETTSPLGEYFAVVNPALRIFRRYGERVTIPPAQIKRPAFGLREYEPSRRPFPAFDAAARDGRTTINEKLGAFLSASAVGVILVDRRYDIISINVAARTMLDIHGVAIGEDLVHLLAPGAAGELRLLLDAALRNQQPAAGGDEIELPDDTAGSRLLTISCYPEVAEGSSEVIGAVVLVVDITHVASTRRELVATIETKVRELQQARAAEIRARERQQSLIEANRDLAGVNSELRAQNDALVIGAEEAEAATEEVETLNEEMQATNEELETLNEEFQATIEELNTTNDEHEAQIAQLTGRLAELGTRHDSAEQTIAALGAIVDRSLAAVAAVDGDGKIVVANGRFTDLQAGAVERSVSIDDDAGATIPLSVVLRRAGEGRAFSFRYRSIAADQSLAVYAGRARPVASGRTRSIIEIDVAGGPPASV